MLSSCVRLSVRPSQVGVLRRLLNLGSRIQRRTIAQDSSLLMPKISAKLQRGRQTEIEWITIDDFWPIFLYILDTLQDRDIFTMES